ncbi:hypothetical protein HDU67_001242 [Dinochytrium kinnereticum]|nr:hypothetical protein HDU67_001242 [Dinochytrium kinnereticum]
MVLQEHQASVVWCIPHVSVSLGEMKSDEEVAAGDAFSRPIISFNLAIMKKGSRDDYLVQKEREPANMDGFGAGTSHPKSWGWATMLPVTKLPEALTADGTLSIYAEVVWYQRRGAIAKIMDQLSLGAEPSSQRLLFNDTLADVMFSVYTPLAEDSGIEDSGVVEEAEYVDGRDEVNVFREEAVRRVSLAEHPESQIEPEVCKESFDRDWSGGMPSSLPPSNVFWQSSDNSITRKKRKVENAASQQSIIPFSEDLTTTTATTTPVVPLYHPGSTCVSPTPSSRSLPARKRKHLQQYHRTLIPAHRSILASRSDYYFAMFSCGLTESSYVYPITSLTASAAPFSLPNSTSKTARRSLADADASSSLGLGIEIEIRDFSVHAIRAMLEFIYTGKLAKTPETKEERFELVKVADRYQNCLLNSQKKQLYVRKIPGLHSYVSGLIYEADLDVNTVIEILELADKYSSVGTELKMSCLSFMAENLTRLKHCKKFMDWKERKKKEKRPTRTQVVWMQVDINQVLKEIKHLKV